MRWWGHTKTRGRSGGGQIRQPNRSKSKDTPDTQPSPTQTTPQAAKAAQLQTTHQAALLKRAPQAARPNRLCTQLRLRLLGQKAPTQTAAQALPTCIRLCTSVMAASAVSSQPASEEMSTSDCTAIAR